MGKGGKCVESWDIPWRIPVSMDIHSGIAAGWDGENDSGCVWNMVGA